MSITCVRQYILDDHDHNDYDNDHDDDHDDHDYDGDCLKWQRQAEGRLKLS